MARYQCGSCGYDGHAAWSGELVCPKCGETDGVRAAIGTDEMTDRQVQWLEHAIAERETEQSVHGI